MTILVHFAYSIIKCLKEGRSETISMLELSSDIMRETRSVSNDEQHPQFSTMNSEDFPIAVRRGGSTTTPASNSPSPSLPSKPIASSPAPGSPPPRPPSATPSTSNQIWGAVTNLAIWGAVDKVASETQNS
jgi:hypothetical protein